MSEYWKSNPRKFCDFCKCWIADNKPSVEFHERGKRHKENVQIRLAEMGKKGREDFEAKQNEVDFLKQMEEAALKAYKSDIEQNPDMTGSKISEIAAASNAEIVIKSKKTEAKSSKKEGPVIKNWYEAKSPEGYTYYWHIGSGESKWEAPEEGYLSIKEQEKLNAKSNKESKDSTAAASASLPCGPVQRAEAFNSWKKVEKYLPELPENDYYGPELSFKQQDSTFEVKTVTLSAKDRGSGESVGFKKRRVADDMKKNMRRRTDDL
ncbi:WW domain-binding protein 4-like [Penaeus japonicus]|uniref:WW domain-binding protein 4-like n=1 Tax=Penaeus japonicus TaxID=27405 RepID=UPI001C7170BE|nr:WW domain-binding protein 4-like [Penaeus japonicus]